MRTLVLHDDRSTSRMYPHESVNPAKSGNKQGLWTGSLITPIRMSHSPYSAKMLDRDLSIAQLRLHHWSETHRLVSSRI